MKRNIVLNATRLNAPAGFEFKAVSRPARNILGKSFFVRHAYFTGTDEPYNKLKRAFRAEIDEAAWSWSSLYSTKMILETAIGRWMRRLGFSLHRPYRYAQTTPEGIEEFCKS